MADDQSPTGFDISGEVYEVPTLDSFDMDEAQILYDLSGVILEDFIPAPLDAPDVEKEAHYQLQLVRVRNPSFRRTLVHVAYRRKHPDYDYDELDKAIGKMNATDVSIAVLTRGDEPDPSMSSPKSSDSEKNGSETSESSTSGSDSTNDSERPVLTLAPTGTSPLGTSYQESPPTPATSAS